MSETITSAANAKVKRLVSLQRKARLRREEKVFVLEGERLFADTPEEYLREIYVTEKFLCEHMQMLREHRNLNAAGAEDAGKSTGARFRATRRLSAHDFVLVTEEIMAKISDTQTPQGVICVADMPSYSMSDLLPVKKSADARPPLLLLLENIQDPGNLGTMFRTAEAAGVTGVLMSRDTVDLFNPKTVRSTMSAVFRVPFLYTAALADDIRRLEKESGFTVYAAHLGADKAYDEVSYVGPTGILVGNEGSGLSEEAAEAANGRILIPMLGEIESLNAAVAAGILMFEAAGQRRHLS